MLSRWLFGFFLAVFCTSIGWAQTHQVASERAVALAMSNPWPALPAPGHIDEALATYKSKLGKNVSITSGPKRMYLPWESDPLKANKVVLTIRADYSPQPSRNFAVVLKYDFAASKFKFEGVLLPGIKRYAGDKSTASMLEPQDLQYLKSGWLSYNAVAATSPGPDDVADLLDEYLRQFERDTCFGRVIQLGDPQRFRAALRKSLTLVSQSREVSKRAQAHHKSYYHSWAVTSPPAEMHVPFAVPLRPRPGQLPYTQVKTLYHETIHHFEYLNGVKLKEGQAGAERNANYLDFLISALGQWKRYEQDVMSGRRTAAEARVNYGLLVEAFNRLEATHGPDLAKLEAWAGIRIRLEDIRALYLRGGCPNGAVLRQIVLNHKPGDESADESETMDLEQETAAHTPAPRQPVSPPVTKAANHVVYGMVVDQVSGKPVAGAAFTVLAPGISTQQWIDSGHDMAAVVAMGVSDASGMVILDRSLSKGKTYSLMVAAPAHQPVSYERLAITDDSQEPLKITVRLKSRSP